MVSDVAECRVTIVMGGREGMFRRQAIVGADDDRAGFLGQAPGHRVVGVEVAGDEAAAVNIENAGRGIGGTGGPVNADRDVEGVGCDDVVGDRHAVGARAHGLAAEVAPDVTVFLDRRRDGKTLKFLQHRDHVGVDAVAGDDRGYFLCHQMFI